LARAAAPPPDLVQHATTRAQCAALDFVRDVSDDPFTGVDLHLQHASVGADRPLAGAVLHPVGQDIGLFLVDPAGRVYDLAAFFADVAETTPGVSRFSVPLRRDGAEGDGALLLLAVASPALERLRARAAETPRAAGFFDAARRQISGNVDISMAGIVLE
jgi:serine/threonine-protein kinase